MYTSYNHLLCCLPQDIMEQIDSQEISPQCYLPVPAQLPLYFVVLRLHFILVDATTHAYTSQDVQLHLLIFQHPPHTTSPLMKHWIASLRISGYAMSLPMKDCHVLSAWLTKNIHNSSDQGVPNASRASGARDGDTCQCLTASMRHNREILISLLHLPCERLYSYRRR
jgi:hypothetical protein